MNKLLVFVGAWVLSFFAGCSSAPSRALPRLAIAFQANRFLELEPCGCSLENLGGVEREFNALAQWRKSLNGATPLILATGSNFVPMTKYESKNQAHYLVKASFLVDAMNELGIQALAPSSDDLAIGLDSIRELEKKAKFKFLSANLADSKTGKPLFTPSLTIHAADRKILLVGLTHGKSSAYPLPREAQVRDPRAGLREALQNAGAVDLVVVLSSFPSAERRSLAADFPEVQLWIGGGPEEDTSFVATQTSAKQLAANSHQRGRGLMTLDIDLVSPSGFKGFFNHDAEVIYRSIRSQATAELEAAEANLKSNKDASKRTALEKRIATERKRVADLGSFPREAGAGVSVYESKALPVNDSYIEPKNSLSELIEKYKKATKKFALNEVQH